MKIFNYKISKNDKTITDTIRATSIEDAISYITKDNSVTLIFIKEASMISKLSISYSKRLSHKELINFFSSISAMDRVGINILQALDLMKTDIAPTQNMKKICESIYNKVISGNSLSIACKSSSSSFKSDFIGLISIAEDTGKLSVIFDELVIYLKWMYDIRNTTKKALTGPIATLVMMVVMIIVMSIMVLPKITEFLSYFNMKTPAYTAALIVFATFVKSYWPLIMGLIFLLPIGTEIVGFFFKPLQIYVDRFKLSLPVFGNLLIKLDTARFLAFFSLMYNSGADIVDIIENLSSVLKNRYLRSRMIVVHQKVISGYTFFKAIDEEVIFPTMFRKMLSICEVTGEVGSILDNIKYFYDKETKDTVDKVVGTIKPTLTIVLGGVLIWMGSAMLGPIYSNIGNLGEVSKSDSGKAE